MLESAVVLPVLFVVLFGMLDLGLAAARYNSLSAATRRVAREAIIHGSQAPGNSMQWGPVAYSGTAADGTEISAVVRTALIAMPAHLVHVQLTWQDHDNSPRDRVRAELSYRHETLIPSLFVWGPLDLRATATMRIVN